MPRPKKQKTDPNSQLVRKQTQVPQASELTGSTQTKTYEIPLSPLPAEIIDLIISYLNAQDIFNLRRVNTAFKYYLDDNHIEKLNSILWGYTFADFQAFNMEGFPINEQQSSESKEQNHIIISKFFFFPEEYGNPTSCADLFKKNVLISKGIVKSSLSTITDAKILDKLANFWIILNLLIVTDSMETIKNYVTIHKEFFEKLNTELISLLALRAIQYQPTAVEILLSLLPNQAFTKKIFLSKIIDFTKSNFRSVPLQTFIIENTKKFELENHSYTLGKIITPKLPTNNLYSLLLRDKTLLSEAEIPLFEFITTGVKTETIINYVANHSDLQSLQGLHLRAAILEKLTAQLFYRENYYFAEWYRKEFNITVIDINKMYYKQPINIHGRSLVLFLKYLIETQDVDFFKNFSEKDNIIALLLKNIEADSSANILDNEIFETAITYKCYEYIEIFIKTHGDVLPHRGESAHDSLYSAALVAHERNKLVEFFKLVFVYCPTSAQAVLAVAAEKNINIEYITYITNNITNRNIINTFFQEKTSLHRAASAGHIDIVRHLLANGADNKALASIGYFKYPAWYLALMNNHTVLATYLLELNDNEDKVIFQAMINNDTAKVKKLLTHTLPTIDGITTLELANLLKCEEIIIYISQTYVLTDPKDLKVAVKYNNFPLVQKLVGNNVDINIRIDTTTSLLTLAIENGYLDIVYYLLSKGAKVSNKDFSYPILLTNKELLLKLFAADENGNFSWTQDRGELLFKAYPDQDIRIELIARGFVNITLVKKIPLLHLLQRIKDGKEVVPHNAPGRIKSSVLVDYKNFKTPQGVTILSFATRVGNDSVIEYYCKSDANLNIFSEDPTHSPILIAAKKHQWNIVIQLLTNFSQQQNKDKYTNYKNILVNIMEIAKENTDKNNMFNTSRNLALKDIINMIEKILYPEKNIAEEIQLHRFSKASNMLTSMLSKLTEDADKNKILQTLWQEAVDQYELIRESDQADLANLLNFIEKEMNSSLESTAISSSSDSDSSSNEDDSADDSSDDEGLLVNNPYLGSGLNFKKGQKRPLEQLGDDEGLATKFIKR